MEQHNPILKDNKLETSLSIPAHPFFEPCAKKASFIQCIDAIDRVNTILELHNFLDLEDGGGLTPKAAAGYFWVSVLTRETLTYTSKRLLHLHRKKRKKQQHKLAFFPALMKSLNVLDDLNREHFLAKMAEEMGITQSELENFIRKYTKG